MAHLLAASSDRALPFESVDAFGLRAKVRPVLHGEDRVSIVSNSASDVLHHLDLVSYEPAMSSRRDECFPTAKRSFFCNAWPMRMWMDKCAMTISVAMLMRSPTIAFTSCA
jgi:hypothetical protein